MEGLKAFVILGVLIQKHSFLPVEDTQLFMLILEFQVAMVKTFYNVVLNRSDEKPWMMLKTV